MRPITRISISRQLAVPMLLLTGTLVQAADSVSPAPVRLDPDKIAGLGMQKN